MSKIKCSCILPSYKDPLSQKTIRSILDNSGLGDQLEVIQVLDGYWPEFELIADPRVRFVHLGQNSGMRKAINAGVSVSRGEFIMRFDEHIMVGPQFDKILTDQCHKRWIMTATRYFLDPVKWERMEIDPVNYEKLVIQDCGNGVRKFAGQRWRSRDKERKDKMIDHTLAMQGSFWCMSRYWWDKVIGELQNEGYGVAYQDSTEMSFKTWQAGGSLVLNKNTWYAHKHRSFSRTHQEGTKENPWKREESWTYALKVWEDYYTNVIKPNWKI